MEAGPTKSAFRVRWIPYFIILVGALSFDFSYANTIQFPEEELARESVYPVFEDRVAVQSRRVVTQGRLEVGLNGGMSLNEPFFTPFNYGLSLAYHFSETHGLNLMYNSWLDGISNYTTQLNQQTTPLNLQYGPRTQSAAIIHYQYAAYYGKMSVSKDYVMNLSLYGLLGLGMTNISGQQFPTLSFGLGQKFYFNSSIALRFDLRMLALNGPDITSLPLSTYTAPPPVSEFSTALLFNTVLNGGISFLF